MSKHEQEVRHAVAQAMRLLRTLHKLERADMPALFSRNIKLNVRKQIKQQLKQALKLEEKQEE